MGVGKTTTCRLLKNKLPNCVFLDGDWCWDMHPFQVTPETKKMVMENICFLLNQFIRCSTYENIIFCWVMHEQGIIDEIISKLETEDCQIYTISLMCDADVLRKRLQKYLDAGIRSEDVIQRSIARIGLYEKLNTEKIDVSHIMPERAAEKIIEGKICGGKRLLECVKSISGATFLLSWGLGCADGSTHLRETMYTTVHP